MLEPHRKKRKAYNEPGHSRFLTYSCINRWPLLARDRTRHWVMEAIEESRRRYDFDLYAFVIMPEHVHLLIRPRRPQYRMDLILNALKRPVSWQAKQWLLQEGNEEWLDRLTVTHGQRKVFRFWLPGGGFDRNIFRIRSIGEVMDYMHHNPVRRGLVQKPTEWSWSSARFWAGMEGTPLKMDAISR